MRKETIDLGLSLIEYERKNPPPESERGIFLDLKLVQEHGFNPTAYLVVPDKPSLAQKVATYLLIKSNRASFATQEGKGDHIYSSNVGEVFSW